ncbi:hypothetical protein GE061_007022 [Apolygus lucorum]|uniref:Oxysterol-binding protein n=1 Tax=Apolygus lucorum TaxID=248454 RepID=A0A6A4IP86_APOLU|nr:hypothetical protein GE061_007022 [Apolygus lucorum]
MNPSTSKAEEATNQAQPEELQSTSSQFDKYRKPDGSIDYDYFYNNPHEGNMQLECTIVRHMLAQIKIGMDLGKITLPTFILERRSLLEMYADHFSHPQLFAAISEGKTSHDRMMAALKWYMSSFHAGRNYDVAKKPYNPILGEMFTCYYDFDKSTPSKPVLDGPVPWANDRSVAFYAEQVSHHPPISAFYAEHVANKVICNAHIWTKSRFYGLSIGVVNAGRAVISLLDHNEQYIFTFPAAYAKGILSVPYVELGGSATAVCPQTGFKAEIEFLTKSLWSKAANRLTCKVFSPNDQVPTDLIEGEWTGVLKLKKCPGSKNSPSKDQVFIDVTATPIHQKLVRPLGEQQPKESRFLWRYVTAALFVNDVDLATKRKSEIEQFQRDEAASRRSNKTDYAPKNFKRVQADDDESPWWYHPSLIDRLQKGSQIKLE